METWTLNGSTRSRNALSEAMVDALLAACERAAADADLRGGWCCAAALGISVRAVVWAALPRPISASRDMGASDPLVPLNRRFGALSPVCAAVVHRGGGGRRDGRWLRPGVLCRPVGLTRNSPRRVALGIVPAQIDAGRMRRELIGGAAVFADRAGAGMPRRLEHAGLVDRGGRWRHGGCCARPAVRATPLPHPKPWPLQTFVAGPAETPLPALLDEATWLCASAARA